MALRLALRALRRAPVHAATVVLTLALGLAALGTMAAVLRGVLFAPLPFADGGRLSSLRLAVADGSAIGLAPAVATTFRRHATQVEDVAIFRVGRANVGAGPDGRDAENIPVGWMSSRLLPVLRAPVLLGRGFDAGEDLRGGPQAVILGEAEWRSRYGASPDALGRTLVVNEVPRVIVGVLPASFAFPHAGVRLWLPAKAVDDGTATDFFYQGVARLAPGASVASAQRELAAILPRLAESHPRLGAGGSTATWIAEMKPAPRLEGLRAALTREVAPMLWLLAAVAALVLLVAWANVANLALLRADAGRHDAALREALGAGALRARAPLLAESILLATIAAALAAAGSAATLWALRRFGPIDFPRLGELALGGWGLAAIAFAAAVGGGIGLLSLALRAPARGLSLRLREGASAGMAAQRLRTAVAALQVAAALVVLAGSAQLLRTAQRLQAVDPGFDAAPATTFQILLPFARYGDAARVAFHARLLERVRALPAVEAAGLVARLPLSPATPVALSYRIDGEPLARPLPVNVASDGYLEALRIPLLAGRGFRSIDAQRPDELLLSRRAATLLFDDPDGARALGRRLTLDPGGPAYTVVGVVGNVHDIDLATPVAPTVYRPQVVAARPGVDPDPLPGMVLVVRSSGERAPLVAAVRAILRELDPGVPLFEVRAMAEVVRQSMARLELLLALTGAAAAVALALGAIGLYGVMACRVALRSREFGLRMALGANSRGIARGVVARGLALAAVGGAAGLALFAALAGALRAAVPGVQVADPVPVVAAMLVVVATAVLASWIPAQRAAAVDPARALRAD
jgi:predicted permease